jgi:isoleucyl-tRNA synthetase
VKGDDEADKQWALAVQREVLVTLAKLFAPVTPYIAESVYRGIGGDEESVHLCEWPGFVRASEESEALLADMSRIRATASLALEARERAGIKIRQPLALLRVKLLPADAGLRQILAEEINVKKVAEDPELSSDVELDTTLTAELQEEGLVRTLMRRVQEWRKAENLTIADRPSYTLAVTAEEKEVATKHREEIEKATGLEHLDIEVS